MPNRIDAGGTQSLNPGWQRPDVDRRDVAGIRPIFGEVAAVAIAAAVGGDDGKLLMRRVECDRVTVRHHRGLEEGRVVFEAAENEPAVARLTAGREHQKTGGVEREVGHVPGFIAGKPDRFVKLFAVRIEDEDRSRSLHKAASFGSGPRAQQLCAIGTEQHVSHAAHVLQAVSLVQHRSIELARQLA